MSRRRPSAGRRAPPHQSLTSTWLADNREPGEGLPGPSASASTEHHTPGRAAGARQPIEALEEKANGRRHMCPPEGTPAQRTRTPMVSRTPATCSAAADRPGPDTADRKGTGDSSHQRHQRKPRPLRPGSKAPTARWHQRDTAPHMPVNTPTPAGALTKAVLTRHGKAAEGPTGEHINEGKPHGKGPCARTPVCSALVGAGRASALWSHRGVGRDLPELHTWGPGTSPYTHACTHVKRVSKRFSGRK